VTKAKLFTATFNRMMENIKEINVAEIFVVAVDDIDPEAMFDLRGRDLSVVFSDGSIAHVHGSQERGAAFDDGQMVTMMGARQPVKLIRAGNVARTEYAVQAGEHLGHDDYSIMQVLISRPVTSIETKSSNAETR
jgi:hypothetical protein